MPSSSGVFLTYYHGTSNAFYVAAVGEDMAYGKGKRFFPLAGVAMLAVALSAGACTTPTEEVAVAPGRSGAPVDTGTYPNLNVPRQGATAQLTDEETQAKLRYLESLQGKQNR